MPISICPPRPQVAQAGQAVLELGHLDLEPRLARAGVAGEDREDDLRAVDDLAVELLLQVPHLGRGQVLVADDRVGVRGGDQALDLLDLALGEQGGRVRGSPLLDELADDQRPGRVGQAGQLVEGGADVVEGPAAGKADQERAFGTVVLPGIVDGTASNREGRARRAPGAPRAGADPCSLGSAVGSGQSSQVSGSQDLRLLAQLDRGNRDG